MLLPRKKFLFCDIDGVILHPNPDKNLPYVERLKFIQEEVNKHRKESGEGPIDLERLRYDNYIRQDNTTDLNWVLSLLDKDFGRYRRLDYSNIGFARKIISQSVDFYFKLLKGDEGLNPTLKWRRYLKSLKEITMS